MTEFGYDPSRIGTSETAAQLLARVNRINFGDLGLHTTRPLHSGDLLALSAEDTRNQPWIFKLALSILCEHLMPTSCGGRESSAHLIICAHTFPAFEFSDLLLAAIHEGAAEYGAPSDAATVLGWHRAAMNRIVVTHCLSLTEVLALARQISARDTSLVLLLGLDAISASHKTVRRHVAAVTALHQLHRSVARTGGLLAFAAHRELVRVALSTLKEQGTHARLSLTARHGKLLTEIFGPGHTRAALPLSARESGRLYVSTNSSLGGSSS